MLKRIMTNFNFSISLDEKGNVKKRVRLIKYNSKILAFNIFNPEMQSFFNSIDEFLSTVKDCDESIFEDLTGENIFPANREKVFRNSDKIYKRVSANALTFRVIPEKKSQIRID
jgi:hypothetical protein